MRTSVDDVPALSALDKVVQSVDSVFDAFLPGWSRPAGALGDEDYYTRDDCYGSVNQ
jgi:hypothetical protein